MGLTPGKKSLYRISGWRIHHQAKLHRCIPLRGYLLPLTADTSLPGVVNTPAVIIQDVTMAEEIFPQFLKIQWRFSVLISLAVPGKLALMASLSLSWFSAPLASSTSTSLDFHPTSWIPSAWILSGLLRSAFPPPLSPFLQPAHWLSIYFVLDPWSGKMPWRRKSHSSILVWEIPWTEEPGGLYSPCGCRVRHNLATKQQCARHHKWKVSALKELGI